MALKGYVWFLGRCLREERNHRSLLSYLAGRALDLGLLRTDSTQGHIFQACGSTQMFLGAYPQYKSRIKQSSPIAPYHMRGRMYQDWLAFFSNKQGPYGRRKFNYNWNIQRNILTPHYTQGPGIPSGGGAGDNEFEIVLRLMTEFIT